MPDGRSPEPGRLESRRHRGERDPRRRRRAARIGLHLSQRPRERPRRNPDPRRRPVGQSRRAVPARLSFSRRRPSRPARRRARRPRARRPRRTRARPGEWLTPPFRLRTKSIAASTPAAARIPASWPAPEGARRPADPRAAIASRSACVASPREPRRLDAVGRARTRSRRSARRARRRPAPGRRGSAGLVTG